MPEFDAEDMTWEPRSLDEVTEAKIVGDGGEPIYFYWNGEPYQPLGDGDETFTIQWTESGIFRIDVD